jgi:predicted dehydrogenase
MNPPLTLAAVGCGGRTRTYLGLAARRPGQFRVVAAADPNPARLDMTRALSRNPEFQGFPDDKALLAGPRLADILVIGTQTAHIRIIHPQRTYSTTGRVMCDG